MPGFDFKDQVVIITGVGRPGQLGHALAEAFGRAGARLVICDVNAVAVAARAREFAAKGIEVRPAAGDLTQPDVANWLVEEATRSFGRLDVLVNVAGGFASAPIADAGPDVFDQQLAINAKTMYVVSRAALKAMVAQKSGAIVSFASISALSPKAEQAAYSAAKASVAAITRALALEVRDAGVRVNAVAPGTVRTHDNRTSMAPGQQLHWVEISELVNAVLFLASEAAAGITGHVLPVSHGEL